MCPGRMECAVTPYRANSTASAFITRKTAYALLASGALFASLRHTFDAAAHESGLHREAAELMTQAYET